MASFITRRWDVKRYNMTAVWRNFSYPEEIVHNGNAAVAPTGCVCSLEEEVPRVPNKTDAHSLTDFCIGFLSSPLKINPTMFTCK